jgi:hypothetical protein
VVDLRVANRMHQIDQCGPVVQIKAILPTLIITADGERYSRSHMKPASEGRYSARELVRADDDRVLCVRGRQHLTDVARVAANLADLPRTDPMDIVAALTRIVAFANEARKEYAAVLAGQPEEKI